MRDHLRALGRSTEAPRCPPELAYLVEWLGELHGRSGASQVGLLPLSPSVLAEWSRLMGITLEPHEAQALMVLDAVMLNPGKAAVTVAARPKGYGKQLWAQREAAALQLNAGD